MATPMQEAETGMRIARGLVEGRSAVHKFGRAVVGTTLVPVCFGNVWQTPQVSGATALRIKAGGNAADTAAGAGAREVTLEGLDETGAFVKEALATAGASASAATTATFLRLFRFYVSKSGSYATVTSLAGSHEADIVIENAAGGTDWGTIDATDFPRGQSEISAYSVPINKTAFIQSINANIDTTKIGTLVFFYRPDILQTAAPYSPMRARLSVSGLVDGTEYVPNVPSGPYPGPCDIGFMGKVSQTTGEIDIDFEIAIYDN